MVARIQGSFFLPLALVYVLLYFLFFLGHGAYFSTLSPYILSTYGADAPTVFLASQGAFPLGYFAAGYFSDRFHSIRPLLVTSLLLQIPSQFFLYSQFTTLAPVVALAALTRFLFAFNFQLITIAAIEGGGILRFGNFRAFGTFGFFMIHLILFLLETGGVFAALDIGHESAAMAGKLGSFFLFTALIPTLSIQTARTSPEPYHFRDALRIALRPGMLLFFLISFLFYFTYQLVDYYLGAYFRNDGGMGMVYGAWALAVLLEIPFMPLTARLFPFHRGNLLFLISAGAGALRFGALTLHTMHLLPFPIILTQLLHGIHFTGFYTGIVYRFRELFPSHLYGTGYGLFMVGAVSFGAMCGNLFFGSLLHKPSGELPFLNRLPLASDYTPLFFLATILQLVIFFCFIFLPDYTRRGSSKER